MGKCKSEILKLEKIDDTIIVYNKDRSVYGEFPWETLEKAKESRSLMIMLTMKLRLYVFGYIDEERELHISHMVATPKPQW